MLLWVQEGQHISTDAASPQVIVIIATPPATTATALPAGKILLSDDFNMEHGGAGIVNYARFAHWTVSNGAVDLIGHGFYDYFPQHGLYVDLDGSTAAAGTLTSRTTFPLAPGSYTLQFSLAGSQRNDTNTATVRLGDVYVEQFTLTSNEPFRVITRTIIIGKATHGDLSFVLTAGGGDYVGLLLDDVYLVQNDAP
jgi:hypothetical protein